MKRLLFSLALCGWALCAHAQVNPSQLPVNAVPSSADIVVTQQEPSARNGDGTVQTTLAQVGAVVGPTLTNVPQAALTGAVPISVYTQSGAAAACTTDVSSYVNALVTAGYKSILIPQTCKYFPTNNVTPTDITIVGEDARSAVISAGTFIGVGTISSTVLTITGTPSQCSANNALAVGAAITGTNVTAGTTVTSLGTGTGCAGTYNLSAASTVGSSEAIAGLNVLYSGPYGRVQNIGVIGAFCQVTASPQNTAKICPLNAFFNSGANNQNIANWAGGGSDIVCGPTYVTPTGPTATDIPCMGVNQFAVGADGIFAASSNTSGSGTSAIRVETNGISDNGIQLDNGINTPAVSHTGIHISDYDNNSTGNAFGIRVSRIGDSTGTGPSIVEDDLSSVSALNSSAFLSWTVTKQASGQLFNLFQSTTAFSGTDIELNNGNSGGTFSGGFIQCVNNNVQECYIDNAGNATFNAGMASGSVTSASTVTTAGYAIGSLPTCNTGSKGAVAYVTNGATSPTYLGTVSATGTTVAPVFCTGAAWIYH